MESGTKLAHYEILSAIGKGGMGEVWKAKDTKLGREVAIKTLPEEFAKEADRVARFRREAQLLTSLNHPNIAAIHGFEEDNGTHFLVLELVEGDTLADRVKRGAIQVEESLKLALQIAEALEAAHEKGVIHRDLKPANVKVTPDGKVKVLDFGLAKAFAGDGSEVDISNSPTLSMQATQQGMILGTAAYMSPEQASGLEVDKSSDIWAFGVVLFEMLTGRRLFTGETATHILASVLKTEPNWRALPPNLHPRIRFLLERCLEKQAKTRLSNILDARIEVERALAEPGVGLTQPIPKAATETPKPSVLPWVAALVLGMVVAGLAVWYLRTPEPSPVTRFYYVLPEDQRFTSAGRPLVAVSPDGSRMVYVANAQLYLKAMDTLESSPIPGTDEDPEAPFFSPDGEWIGYWSGADGQLKKIAVSGGAPVTLSDANNPLGAPSWGADDRIVYGQLQGIMRVSANGGTPEILIEGGSGTQRHPEVLPDGRSVLFEAVATGDREVVVQSPESGEEIFLFAGSSPRYVPTGHIVYGLDGVLFAVPFDTGSLEVTGGPVPLVEGVRVDGVRHHYAISDSGVLVYVPGSAPGAAADSVITWVDRTGVREPLPLPPRPYRQPQISPDGTRLAVEALNASGESDIWVYDLDGSTQMRQMTGEGNNYHPIWTPDGERLTFASDRDGQVRIYWQLADLSGVAEPLTEPEEGLGPRPDAWAPDGRTLAFTRGSSVASEGVWTLSLDDGAVTEVFAGGSVHPGYVNAGSPAFSPDGQWLVYRRNPVGEGGQLFVEPFPTTGTEFRLTQDGGSAPIWSRDGRELFYRRNVQSITGIEGGAQSPNLMAVDISLEGTPEWGNQRVLPIEGFLVFQGSVDYDITADGERFLMVFPEDQTDVSEPVRPQINIVLNWFEELKERVPVP